MLSKPEVGALLGLVAGALVGMIGVFYFGIEPWFDRLCLVGSVVLICQLLGSTIAAAIGKPD